MDGLVYGGGVTVTTEAVSAIETPPVPGQELTPLSADVPITNDSEDLFHFDAIADALHELIDHPDTTTPLSLAISARWGSGKSSLAALLVNRLEADANRVGDEPHIVIRFNAWQHQHARDPASSLTAAIVPELARRHSPWRRLHFYLTSPLAPRARQTIVRMLVLITLIALFVLAPQVHTALGVTLAAGGAIITSAVTYLASTSVLYQYIRKPQQVADRGAIKSVRVQLDHLAAQVAADRRIVVVVDDLDRLPAEVALAYLETSRLLLDHENFVTIFLVDGRALERFAAQRVGDAASDVQILVDSSEFVRKLVQLRFDIPPFSADQLRNLLLRTPFGGDEADYATDSDDDYSLDISDFPDYDVPPGPAWEPIEFPDIDADDDGRLNADDLFYLLRSRVLERNSRTWLRWVGFALLFLVVASIVFALSGTGDAETDVALWRDIVGNVALAVMLIALLIAGGTVLAAFACAVGDVNVRRRIARLDDELPLERGADFTLVRSHLGPRLSGKIEGFMSLAPAPIQARIREAQRTSEQVAFDDLWPKIASGPLARALAAATPRDVVRVKNRYRFTYSLISYRRNNGFDVGAPSPAQLGKWSMLVEFSDTSARELLVAGASLSEMREHDEPPAGSRPGRLSIIDVVEVCPKSPRLTDSQRRILAGALPPKLPTSPSTF